MSEPKKLSDLELTAIRESADASHRTMHSLPEVDRERLLMHIDAIEAEHQAAMTRAREDADRVGAARIAFEDEQQKRIEALEDYSLMCYATITEILGWKGMKSEAGDQVLSELLIRMPASVHKKLVNGTKASGT